VTRRGFYATTLAVHPSPLHAKIERASARVVVIGVGYVGLPLALEFARKGFHTTGLDSDPERVELLRAGRSYIPDVLDRELTPLIEEGRLHASADPAVIAEADVVVVCVPTPLNKTRDPDMSPVLAAVEQIERYQHEHMLVVLESTSYPGTTSEILVPRLTRRGQELGKDLFVAFSPERIDPGNLEFRIRNTPKVIGGATPACLEMASLLYSRIIERVVPVSSTETAEMVKLLENTFRAVNIALVNEIAIASRKLGVDPFEVIRAASTKPFGYLPFYPGPGLGGHCLPVDPLYLSWRLRGLDHPMRFIELADAINGSMPRHVVGRVAEALNEHGRALKGARVLVYGAAYKRDVNDTRESPALPILSELLARGARVAYQDPFVPRLVLPEATLESEPETADFSDYDAVVVVTDHSRLDRPRLLREARLVVDTRDALHDVPGDRGKVYGL
jgi:UDP-N-acetyl-D-glucosamine dehydrogenase